VATTVHMRLHTPIFVAMKWSIVAFLTVGFVTQSWAEESDPGKTQYLSGCAGCHGSDAKGSGPRSSSFKAKPPDLATLAKRNKGVFPVSFVYRAIDGRGVDTGHDVGDMPVWGCRHLPPPTISSPPSSPFPFTKRKRFRFNSPRLNDYQEHLNLACDSEDVIANRILSVVEYLRRIQER
jgi:mono/diheme cytochrome c family protein